MSLITLAESDLAATLESVADFGESFRLTDPDGVFADLTGQDSTVSSIIDPETGVQVSGKLEQVTARISSILGAGLTVPVGVEDSAGKPWLVTRGAKQFKIFQTLPDEKLGIISMILEPYNG